MAKDKSSYKASKRSNGTSEMPKARKEAPKPSADKGKARISEHAEELRQNIRALGGDDEDLELLAGVDSDEELAGGSSKINAATERALKKELGAFMKGLDFAKVRPQDMSIQKNELMEEEEDEDEDEDEEVDEESEEDEEEVVEEHEEDDEEDANEVSDELATSPDLPKASLPPTSTSNLVDRDPTSGSNLPAAPVWTELLPALPPLKTPAPFLSPSRIATLKARGTQLLESLPPLSRAGSSSDAAFISQILSSGTHSDKLSALVLLVRESPIHAVKELGRLRNMTGWKEGDLGSASGGGNKDQRVAVIKALADWWVSGGGKKAGKLKYFGDQPMLARPDITDRHLVIWAFEDFLKRWFFNLLQVIEALYLVFQLLSGNAEQEQNLMRLGVNKLGDNDKSVASKTSHHLLQLLQVHPAMKSIVAREVSAMVLKPASQSSTAAASSSHVRFDESAPKKADAAKVDAVPHGRYYGLIALNQLSLTKSDQEVAGKLVTLYFEVFREVLGESMKADKATAGEGVPEGDEPNVEKVAGKVERWRGRKKGSKQKEGRKTALESEEALVETGEARLIAAVLTGIHRALPYAKLDDALFNNYMDTLFRITHAGTFNTSIAALQLIFQVCQARQDVSDRFYRTLYDSLFDGRLFTSSKQAMYLNLLFKAMKADTLISRVMAFVKRLLQMLGMHQPPFICGALYLLGELFSTTPGLRRMLVEPEDDDLEHFHDASEDPSLPAPAAGSSRATYDGKKREPQYAHADSSCLWELLPFLDHFHPSVSLQAAQLLEGVPITGSAHISLNTLVSFLDRFVYRNPKKNVQAKGASVMQPGVGDGTMLVQQKGTRSAMGMVNSEAFWRKKIEEVPVDQLFFHKFFASKLSQKESSRKSRKGQSDDEMDDLDEDDEVDVGDDAEDSEEEAEAPEDEDEEEFEEDEDEDGDEEEDSDPEEAEIWKVCPSTSPEMEADGQAMRASMPDAEDEIDLSDVSDSESGSSEYDMVDGDAGDDVSAADSGDDDEEDAEEADEQEEEDGEGDGDSDFPDLEDEDEDLIPMDEMPDIVLGDSSAEDEEPEPEGKKRKRQDDRKDRKKKRKEMPVFGSYEDYAAMIEAAGNEGED